MNDYVTEIVPDYNVIESGNCGMKFECADGTCIDAEGENFLPIFLLLEATTLKSVLLYSRLRIISVVSFLGKTVVISVEPIINKYVTKVVSKSDNATLKSDHLFYYASFQMQQI